MHIASNRLQVDVTSSNFPRRARNTNSGNPITAPAALGHPEYPFLVRLREYLTAWPNVDIVNPLPKLREAQAQQAMYDANDEHLSPAGQHEIAALLRQQLHLQ